jgi:hypothetical protein
MLLLLLGVIDGHPLLDLLNANDIDIAGSELPIPGILDHHNTRNPHLIARHTPIDIGASGHQGRRSGNLAGGDVLRVLLDLHALCIDHLPCRHNHEGSWVALPVGSSSAFFGDDGVLSGHQGQVLDVLA